MKKLNKQDYIFRGFENQQLEKLPGQIDGQSFLCKQLKNCQVYLCDFISSMYVLNCENSQIYIGPIKTAIFVRNCKNCTISCAAQQVRVSDSQDIQIFGFSKTDFTIENCKNLVIAPYNLRYQGLNKHFEDAGLDYNLENRIFRVMDFTPTQDSYQIMQKEQFQGYVDKIIDQDQNVENPVQWPQYFGGELDYDVFKKLDCQNVEEMMNPNKQKDQIKQKQDNNENINQNQTLSKIDKLKQEMQQREEQKQLKLREQNLQEMEQKKQRLQKALEQKQKFVEEYKNKIQISKTNKISDDSQNTENINVQKNWDFVKENISLKISDQTGNKDLSTFRRCLENKFNDNNQIIQQYLLFQKFLDFLDYFITIL